MMYTYQCICFKKNLLATGITTALVLGTSFTTAAEQNEKAIDEIEVIEVTGNINQSYLGAIGEKRVADTVVDVITSEDIGQFSDDSIAGALQRIPGIQIEVDQAGTDGDRVSIRGLGSEFVNSTINGRSLLSSGNEAKSLRKMNFNVFPSSVLSGVRVAKGQTAVAPESGLAGQVDLQTIRPLDLTQFKDKNYFGVVSLKGEYRDLADDDGSVLEGSFAWRNDLETFGFYAGVVLGDSDITNEQFNQTRVTRNIRVDNDGDGTQDELISGVNVPNSNTGRQIEQNLTREAFSAGLQWRPSEDIDIVWDITSTVFDNQSQRHNGQMIMNPIWGGTVFDTNGIEIDENNALQYADFSQTTGGGNILSRIQDMKFNNDTENFISGINVNWIQDTLTTNVDVYYSSVEYSQDLRFPVFNKAIDKKQATYDGRGEVPRITTGEDRLNPAGYNYLFSTIREIELDGENYGATLKFNYALETLGLASVDFGLHYEKTDIESIRTAAKRVTATNAQKPDIVANSISGELTENVFLGGENFSPSHWLISDFDAVGAILPDVYLSGVDNLGIDYGASHDSQEEILAVFGQLNLDTEISDLPLTGNIGLRAVQTKNKATAYTTGADPEAVANTTDNDYWEYLPSINLKLAIQEDLALRFGFSKTLSRPEYSDMAPIIRANLPTCEPDELPEDCKGNATAGNAELNPMTSLNYDVTFEYYNETDGAAVVSLFYKDVSDFIISDISFSQTLLGQPTDILYDITTPSNFSDGEAKGYEIGFYQPFDKLIPALTGFGMSANYTYVESEFDDDVGDSGFGFPGSSENNVNFVGFYENKLFSVRLAYIYRDDFFRSLAGQGSQTSDARFTGDTEKLDLNIKVRPIKNLTLSFNAQNLLEDNRRDHIGDEGKFLAFFETGRTYSITARYKF